MSVVTGAQTPITAAPLGVWCWLCWSFTTCLSTGGWSAASLHMGPSLVTCCQCSHKVQSGISWGGCSISTCTASTGCHVGGNPQAMVRAVCVVQFHQLSSHISVSSFTFTFSLPDVPISKTNLGLLCPKFLKEGNNLVCFSCLQTVMSSHQQWWLGRWCTGPPWCSFAAQEFPR